MNPLIAKLLQKRTVLLDGAWGTELQKHGFEIGQSPERMNLTHPAAVRSVAASYVAAGAEIILTNTFGGTRINLNRYDLGGQTVAINRAGVALSKEAAGHQAFVFASMGPIGEWLEPVGDLEEEAATEAFSEQATALLEGGADGIVIETMSDPREALLAVKAVKKIRPDCPLVCSMTYDIREGQIRTITGATPAQVVALLEPAGCDLIGANCGMGIEAMCAIQLAYRAVTRLPLWAKPNAGLPVEEKGKISYRETPDHMAARLHCLIEAGASFIGGCCGTTPAHIQAFGKILEQSN